MSLNNNGSNSNQPNSGNNVRRGPEGPFTMALLHSKFTAGHQERIANIITERHRDLASLYFSTRDKSNPAQLESGFRSTRIGNDIVIRENDGLNEFLAKYQSLERLNELDLSMPPSPPSPPLSSLKNTAKEDLDALTKSIISEDVMDVDESSAASSLPPAATLSKRAQEKSAVLPKSTPSAPSTTQLSSLQTIPSPPKATSSPALSHPSNPIASTSSLPYPSPSGFGPSTPIGFDLPPTDPSLPYTPLFAINEISNDYVSYLPELPLDVKKLRVNNGGLPPNNKRKGKEKAGGPDLYKMNIKAHHTGAKNFLGKGNRVHNVLSTHDWSVALEEVRANRAFERIEQLKADKAWTFRQPKKQRTGQVPKAHWDHLLDEMRWLHTDFRQETRWKVTTAYNLARAVKSWHKASPEKKVLLQVKFAEPKLLPVEADRVIASLPSSPAATSRPSTPARTVVVPLEKEVVEADGMVVDSKEGGVDKGKGKEVEVVEMDIDADGEAEVEALIVTDADGDVDADGEADDVSVVAGPSTTASAIKAESVIVGGTPRTPATQASEAQQRAYAVAQELHKAFALRGPIFDLGVTSTVIDPKILTEEGVTLSGLFPDLALYSSFNPGDLQLEKRTEESSAWAGRLSLVSKLLESKPFLVSTLQPSRIRTKDGWETAAATILEDVKEVVEVREPPAAVCPLFTGKKQAKDNQSSDQFSKPVSVPDPDARASSLHWGADEDAIVVSLQRQYGTNWNLIADVFNGTTVRPSADNRLAWDMYDRWDKLVGPSSKKTLPDGTEIKIPAPEYTPQGDKSGKGQQFATFDGSKKRLRHMTVFDAIRKVQKKREVTAQKIPPPAVQRRVNMSMHESHNLPPRPFYSPMEWSHVKVEQDQHKMRNRQIQHQQEIAQQRQQHQQQLAAQQQLQNGGVRYQQAPPQGFPVQQSQPRLNSLPLNIARNGSPAGNSPGGLSNTSPRILNQTPPASGQIPVPNGLGLGLGGNVGGVNGVVGNATAAQLVAQFSAQNGASMTPEKMAAYQQQLQLQMQLKAEGGGRGRTPNV